MPVKWSRRVFSFRFYEGKISVPVTLTSCAFRKSYLDVMAPRLSCINLQRGLLLPGFRRVGRMFPSLDITTTVSGLLCWRDSHPLEWQLEGSEYPAVVIPVLTQHYAMLQRNLLYTGVTRIAGRPEEGRGDCGSQRLRAAAVVEIERVAAQA
jgi:hypothetical protein